MTCKTPIDVLSFSPFIFITINHELSDSSRVSKLFIVIPLLSHKTIGSLHFSLTFIDTFIISPSLQHIATLVSDLSTLKDELTTSSCSIIVFKLPSVKLYSFTEPSLSQ